MSTEISWTDETWNPTVGCSRVSPGCDNCYAIRVAARGMQDAHRGLTRDGDWTGEVRCLPDRLDTPLRWKKPRRVFVDSMSDLFHPDVPEKFIADVFDVMACHGPIARHTFQVLTKRPQRMRAILARWAADEGYVGAPNVWLGTSIENQRYADMRIPHLLATPAVVRFLSVEPLLGPVDLYAALDPLGIGGRWTLSDLDWVIVGGESGSGARPMQPGWAEQIVAQCQEAGVAVFVKQLGTVLGGKTHHDIDTFPEALRVREWPLVGALA